VLQAPAPHLQQTGDALKELAAVHQNWLLNGWVFTEVISQNVSGQLQSRRRFGPNCWYLAMKAAFPGRCPVWVCRMIPAHAVEVAELPIADA
jgi:hypothetical protein